jgi:hypothetical protein
MLSDPWADRPPVKGEPVSGSKVDKEHFGAQIKQPAEPQKSLLLSSVPVNNPDLCKQGYPGLCDCMD